MSYRVRPHIFRFLFGLAFGLALAASACAPAATSVLPTPVTSTTLVTPQSGRAIAPDSDAPAGIRPPTYAEITPGPHKEVPDLSTTIEIPPFSYSAPLPPPAPSVLDGLYSKFVPLDGTPVPCKRCAGYRLEGGLWTLYLNRGVFKVFQQETDFEAVGSFTVSNNHIQFFNDPYCEEDMTMIGDYSWESDARGQLRLTVVKDVCSIAQRAKNLTSSAWVKTPLSPAERAAGCQPPSREAAATDHWAKPPYCK